MEEQRDDDNNNEEEVREGESRLRSVAIHLNNESVNQKEIQWLPFERKNPSHSAQRSTGVEYNILNR